MEQMRREDITSMEDVVSHLDGVAGAPKPGDVVKSKIIEISNNEIVLDLGGKFEGFISLEHLVKPISDYKLGEEIIARVSRVLEDEGRVLLTEKGYLLSKILADIERSFNEGDRTVEGKIEGEIKGGYSVSIGGIVKGFLPYSQSMFRRNERVVGKQFKFYILDFQRRRRNYNLVLSRKRLKELEVEKFMKKIEVGQEIEGTVESVRSIGVFVNLGPVTGFIPPSEISWDDSLRPRDVCKKNQRIKVKVINKDEAEGKVTLSLKRMTPDPWESVDEKYKVGDVVSGTVKKIFPFGFTVKLEPGVEGLVHISEIFWGSRRKNIRDVVRVNQRVNVEILKIDKKNRKISLSFKRAKGDPWENIEQRYPIGTKVKGRITKVLPIGVIVDIEDGVSGFVHVSELSWNFVDNVENLVEMDQEVECVVLSMDKEKRKLGLSLKRAREDPWKKVAEELRVGDKVSGEVVRMIDTGAFVMIDGYGIEAFLPVSQVSMDRVGKIEDILQIGQKIEAKIIRMVYNPENDTRNMVISMKQIQLEKEREEYEKYMKEHAGSTLTLEEFLKEKYG